MFKNSNYCFLLKFTYRKINYQPSLISVGAHAGGFEN